FSEAHNATADVEATTRCFLELIRREVFTAEELQVDTGYFVEFKEHNPDPIEVIGVKHINLKLASDKVARELDSNKRAIDKDTEVQEKLKEATFVHLHNHSQFSVLQSTISINNLVDAAVRNKMHAVALTDHGNMMGAFSFVSRIESHNKSLQSQLEAENVPPEEIEKALLKPIVGCELFVCENHLDKTQKDNGYQIVFLAKNKRGYHNLAKMSSIAYTEGFYYVPRIDKAIVEQYKEDLIVLSGNLSGEIPNKLLNMGFNQAEEALVWWKEQFGEDFYVEIMRHGQEDEDRANLELINLADKHGVQLIATNNTYYIAKEDAHAHDILLCVKDGEKLSTPKGRGRGFRFGLPNQEYFFKSAQEMKDIFKDIPDAIINIQGLIDKIEPFTLSRGILLPKFHIPKEFEDPNDDINQTKNGENAYLKHLTYQGAKARYGEVTESISERLDFELDTIEKTGYPGYFLIVQDLIAEARRMGVSVGPGRGSAAGSAVAYCLGITNIDPIEYDLLFERFLNPDRVSMPDID